MPARSPHLESWAARAGVAVLVGLSIWLGWRYWQDRGEEQLAWITVGAELIAFAGLAVSRGTWAASRAWAAIAILLTILAASWCGLTVFQKISDDSRARAIAAAERSLVYSTARTDLETASADLRLALAAPRPTDQGPLTIAAWDAAQAATVARLSHARDDALVRVNAALPAPALDWLAVARGVGVEMIKLLGFAAFGLASVRPPERQPWRPVVVEGGRTTEPRSERPVAQPGAQPGRRSLGRWAVTGLMGFLAAPPQSAAESPKFPIEAPPDSAVARPIAPIAETDLPVAAIQMSARRMGEVRIAAALSLRAGKKITRHQVRIWLGRVASRSRAA